MNDRFPSRRQLLSAGGLAAATALAGCLNELQGSDGAGGTDDALRLTLARGGDSLRERYVLDLDETRPDWDEEAFEAARTGEDYTTQYRKPFLVGAEEPAYATHEGTYYELGSVVVDEVETAHPVLRLFAVDETDSSSDDAVAASALPEADERAVKIAYFAARARGNEGGVPWGLVQRGGYVYRREEAIEASELLADDGPERVTYRETTYAVETTPETFYEPVYRPTVEPVAEQPERIEAILRAQLVDARFTRDDLSDEARRIVEQTRADSYRETHPYSEAYQSVLRHLHKHAYLDGNVRKDAGVHQEDQQLLRYDGRYYDYRLRFVPAEE